MNLLPLSVLEEADGSGAIHTSSFRGDLVVSCKSVWKRRGRRGAQVPAAVIRRPHTSGSRQIYRQAALPLQHRLHLCAETLIVAAYIGPDMLGSREAASLYVDRGVYASH